MRRRGRSCSAALDLKAFRRRMDESGTEREAERCDVSADDPWLDFKASLNSFNLQKFLFLPALLHPGGPFASGGEDKEASGTVGALDRV